MATLFTVGHSTRTTEALLEILVAAVIDTVVDVRRFPGSRRHPHLARENLEKVLPERGITYEWCEALGGRRSVAPESRHPAWRNASFQGYADHMDGVEFRETLETFERRAEAERIAFMCAEAVWWRCHRRLISDALTIRGHDVVHLLGPNKRDGHRLHPNVRADDDGWPVYDVNVDLPLELP